MQLRSERQRFLRRQLFIVISLWVAVMAAALGVIYTTYDTRLKFNELQVLKRQQDQLQVEWGKYLLEESAWASYSRVEKIATEKLSMQIPEGQKIITVNANEG